MFICGVRTGKEEQISAMAIPTNHVKKVTTTQPHNKLAGPAYRRLCPYRGVPVNTDMHENVMASVFIRFCIILQKITSHISLVQKKKKMIDKFF